MWCNLALLILLWMPGLTLAAQPDASIVASADPAKVVEQQAARRQGLEKDRETIEDSRQNLQTQIADLPEQMESLRPEQINEALVEQTTLDVKSALLHQETAATELSNAERRIQELQKVIADLEAREQLLKNPAKDAVDGAADRAAQLEKTSQLLGQQRAELELESFNLANLRAQSETAKLRLTLVTQWQERVERMYRQRQEQSRQDAQAELISRLQTDLATLQDRANTVKQRLARERGALSLAAWQRLETELRTLDEHINLRTQDRSLAEIGATLARLNDLLKKTEAPSAELERALKQLVITDIDLRRTDELLQQKTSLYAQQRQVIERRGHLTGVNRRLRDEEAQLIDQLLAELNQRTEQVQNQRMQLNTIEAQLTQYYQDRLHQDLFTRKPYPDSAEAWGQLWQDLATVPQVLFYQVRLSGESAFNALLEQPLWRWLRLLALEAVLIWLVLKIRRGLRQTAQRMHEEDADQNDSFLRRITQVGLRLARANLLGAGSAAALWLLLWLVEAPQPGFGILMTLALVWVGIKLPISLARLLLTSPRLPEEQRQLSLYRQLFWTLTGGGVLGALVILAHLSDLPNSVVHVFDRLFMLYWFWAFVPGMRIRRLITNRLGAVYDDRMWFAMLRFGSLLLPLSLMGAAILGLLGYPQLAWLVAGHLLILITVLVGALLLRSLLNDLVVALKNYAVAHSGYGLLWTQDVIAPLHRITNLLLFLGAGLTLFRAYGWTGESAVITSIWRFLEQPLFAVGGADITLWRIALTTTLLLVVVWLGQWSRAVTYRWLFSRMGDLGVRHSLSVFTQYAVVLIGLIVILRIIGIDLTTLAVFAGAVGVGLGLGLKDLANNFISGLFLLIERPLRSGDIVKIGAHEGEVSSIGMRSLSLRTFDNQMVIIPNSAVTGEAFTNWTHQDRVLRTMLVIGISYDSEPHTAKAIIERTVREHEAVLKDPEPSVLLWEFADSSVNFRVYYFVDIGQNSGLKTRDQILFTIWDRFKEADIRIPYPQRDLYIKAWPGTSESAGSTQPNSTFQRGISS
ncbi:MAG: potassium-dependent mechanosensitive channel [Pseudomonadota bacterium]|nr:potassium-dependent mechanosensitive channel [Pseudomonadota bacterium]